MCSFINSEQSIHVFVVVLPPCSRQSPGNCGLLRALEILCEISLPARMQREHSQDHLGWGQGQLLCQLKYKLLVQTVLKERQTKPECEIVHFQPFANKMLDKK